MGIFVVSTYNTDYIMVKKENIKNTIKKLKENNNEIRNNGVRPNST
jgi:hypothetical protein